MTGPSVVAIGGGTGLPTVLKAARSYAGKVTAVVTVADNGGSSGRLRRELGILPPGDIRNCLVALSDDESLLPRVFQYRFKSGSGIAGHAIGNLIIAALTELRGDFVGAIADAGKMLGTQGRVLPSTLSDVTLFAMTEAGGKVAGQARIAKTKKPIVKVALEPEPEAYAGTIEAIREANQIIIGPGSLYTSILPNLLVPGVLAAVSGASARRIFVMNAMTQRGETQLCSAVDHMKALLAHAGAGVVDVVLANVADGEPEGLAPVDDEHHLIRPCAKAIESMGIEVKVADIADDSDPSRHDAKKLALELEKLL